MQYDSWHRLDVEDGRFTLGGHTDCASYPDGPEPEDTAYACPTECALGAHGVSAFSAFFELHGLSDGAYEVRYWQEPATTRFPDSPAKGVEVRSR